MREGFLGIWLAGTQHGMWQCPQGVDWRITLIQRSRLLRVATMLHDKTQQRALKRSWMGSVAQKKNSWLYTRPRADITAEENAK